MIHSWRRAGVLGSAVLLAAATAFLAGPARTVRAETCGGFPPDANLQTGGVQVYNITPGCSLPGGPTHTGTLSGPPTYNVATPPDGHSEGDPCSITYYEGVNFSPISGGSEYDAAWPREFTAAEAVAYYGDPSQTTPPGYYWGTDPWVWNEGSDLVNFRAMNTRDPSIVSGQMWLQAYTMYVPYEWDAQWHMLIDGSWWCGLVAIPVSDLLSDGPIQWTYTVDGSWSNPCLLNPPMSSGGVLNGGGSTLSPSDLLGLYYASPDTDHNSCMWPYSPRPIPSPGPCADPGGNGDGCPPLSVISSSTASWVTGTIKTSPPASHHLVGLQSCFWISGAAVDQGRKAVIVASPGHTYEYTIDIGWQGVNWDLRDGSSQPNGFGEDLSGTACNGNSDPGAVRTTYRSVSDDASQGYQYDVSATESIGVQVMERRCDFTTNSDGSVTVNCSGWGAADISGECAAAGLDPVPGDGSRCIKSRTLVLPIFVGQAEKIPVSR